MCVCVLISIHKPINWRQQINECSLYCVHESQLARIAHSCQVWGWQIPTNSQQHNYSAPSVASNRYIHCIALYKARLCFLVFAAGFTGTASDGNKRTAHSYPNKALSTIHYNLLHGSSGWSGIRWYGTRSQYLGMWIDVHVYGWTQGDAVVSS